MRPRRNEGGTRPRWLPWPPWRRTTASSRETWPGTTRRAGPWDISLPPEEVALSTGIGAAAKRAALRIDADGNDSGAHRVRAEDTQLVAERGQPVADRLRNAVLDLEHAGQALVIVERAEGMERVGPRRLDRLLDAHAEHED